MAKSKRQQSAAAKKSPTEPPAVKRALQKLRDFYQDGLLVIEAAQGSTRRQLDPRDVVKTFARERGMYPDYYWQARKFAETYTEERVAVLGSCVTRRRKNWDRTLEISDRLDRVSGIVRVVRHGRPMDRPTGLLSNNVA